MNRLVSHKQSNIEQTRAFWLKQTFLVVMLMIGVFLVPHVAAQDLSNLSEKKALAINGGISYNAIGYSASGIEGRRDPFSWYLSGNLNLSLYGWSVPLTFNYTNRQLNYTQPFNQIGLTPQYKWAKAHIGYSSMNFSTYSLSGHTFFGGGLELTPGPWRINAMYGRLNKANEPIQMDSLYFTDPVYKRMGYGTKVGYHVQGFNLDVSLFSAEDETESIGFVPQNSEVTPESNWVWGISGNKQLMERVNLSFEFAQSHFNRNLLQDDRNYADTMAIETKSNAADASGIFEAYNFGIGYGHSIYSLLLKYERIDPGYKTLGAYYNNNDMENVTISGNLNLLQNKLSLALSSGIQKNNLDDTEASATKRVIMSANVNYSPSAAWNLATSYSNFNTYTNIRPDVDPTFTEELDTLNFYQINQSTTFSVMRSFGSKESRKNLSLNGSFQTTNEESTGAESTLSSFYSGNLAYLFSIKDGLSAGAAFNANKSNFGKNESLSYGPNVNLSKGLLKKNIRSNFSATYLKQNSTGRPSSGVVSLRLNFALKPQRLSFKKGRKKDTELRDDLETASNQEISGVIKDLQNNKHDKGFGQQQIGIGCSYMRKLTSEGSDGYSSPAFSELTATFNYRYNF